MKAQLNSWPAWLKVLVYFLLLWLATFIGGVVPALNDFIFFFSVSLLISWVFLHAEARSVRSLGFVPRSKKDYQEFFTGVSIGGIMLISTVVITLLLTRDHLGWNYAQQLIPRTAGGRNSGIITVSTGHINYAHWMVIGPYLLIVTLVITWFAIVMRARRNCEGFSKVGTYVSNR